MLQEETINANYATFVAKIAKYGLNQQNFEKETCGLVKTGSFSVFKDSGCAYEGSLIDKIFKLTTYAVYLADLIAKVSNKTVNKESLVKVCLLQHISKSITLVKNTNQWEVEKRGMIYTYADNKTTVKTGALSALIAMRCGISFTDEEYEAMTIIDRDLTDQQAQYHSCLLSVIVKQSNEMLYMMSK